MKKVFILSIVFMLLFSVVLSGNNISVEATANEDLNYVDLNNWSEDFPVDQSNGTWTIEDGGRSLIQSVNDDPTGYLSPDTAIDKVIMGTIEVESPPGDEFVDNDFIGFILGYQDPNESSGSYDYDFILFDWRRGDQDDISMEGYTLKKIDGTVTTNDYNEYFWDNINDSSDNDMTILAANHNNNGWKYDQKYLFKILYTKDKIKIKVDDEVVFDISGTFKDGKYGFYNYSQPYVKYGEVQSALGSSTQLAPVAVDDNYVLYKEDMSSLEIDRFNGILANDYDPNLDSYDIVTQSSVSGGVLDLSTTSGAFTYISDGSTGKDTFSYVLRESENINEESTTATATISVVNGSNETPSALNITPTTPTSISYSGSDIDLETDKIDDIDYVFGKLSTEDQEGDYHDYMLIDNSEGKFGIKDNEIFIANKLEEGQSYSIKVRSTDLGGLSVEQDFTINVNANYDKKYYRQNIQDDEYTLVVPDSETLEGYVGKNVSLSAIDYIGFHEINYTGQATQGAIKADGTLSLERYYDRNLYTVEFVDHDGITTTQSVKYEGSATAPDATFREGYTFTGWDENFDNITSNLTVNATYSIDSYDLTVNYTMADGSTSPANHTEILDYKGTYSVISPLIDGYTADNLTVSGTMGTSDIVEEVTYTANTNTAYKVNHYQEQLDGTYTLVDTDNLTGTTNTTETAQAKTYTGFSENTTHADRKESGNITGDGSLVLKLYYDREEYTVIFNDHDGTEHDTKIVKYLGTPNPSDPTRTGYTFTVWDKDITNITGNLTTTALYSINEYTITFDTDGGSTVEDIIQDYGTDITPPENPTKAGYSFVEWNPNLYSTMPAINSTLNAQWLAEGDTKYTVEHYQQNINDDEYTLKDWDIDGGKTESLVTAGALTYNGFYFDEDNASNKTSGEIIGDGSLTLKLYYNREEYTVTFLNHEDEVLKTETVRYQGSATPPPRPSRTGYDFRIWSEDYSNVISNVVTKATYRKEEPEPVVQESTVVVNGEEQSSGTETSLEVDGEMTATYSGDAEKIEEKIDQVLQDKEENNEENTEQNTLEIPIQTTNPDRVTSKLTGDIVKKLEDENFNINIKTDSAEYELPAEEITITKVAQEMDVDEASLEKIEVNIEMNKASPSEERQAVVKGREEGYRVLTTPIEFTVKAKTTSNTGEEKEVEIKEFKKYVKRRLLIPEDVDPEEITTAVLLEENGNATHIPTEVYELEGRWYAKINSLTNSKYTLIYNNKEVENLEGHWAKEAVEDLVSRKVIEDTKYFLPDASITRGQFAEYITKSLGIYREEVEILEKFTDVEDNDEILSAVYTASKYGIIKGYPDGSFRPEEKITREEAMVMYSRAMEIVELTNTEENKIEGYKDKEKVSDWAFEEVNNTLGAGVFIGTTSETIEPKGDFTFVEAANAVRNLLIEAELINE